ncbi:MAG TPA: class I SAM-dependent methyltransferase [Bacteroidia bacterium]|jgi:SAM-dependent methyltransferase|nr:class I SAM-dependent methyltransferase [Bacteroidia bacterium]
MLLVSPLLDKYFRSKLKNENTRRAYYQKALKKELRNSKLGQIALRNLNELMAENTLYHKEFEELLNGKNYQEAFWESDLGYLWYQGNLQVQNSYFALALEEINKHKYTSVLDVGCGWGEFTAKAAACISVNHTLGIDISVNIIAKAKELQRNSKAVFECIDAKNISEKFDLITLFGSTDYIPPIEFPIVLEKLILSTNKQIILVNSLRKVSFDNALTLTTAQEIKRYDTGCVQPIKYLLDKLKEKYAFTFNIEKAGLDSVIARIYKA